MYVESRWQSLDKSCMIIKKYHTWQYNKQGGRSERKSLTSTEQQAINQRHRAEKYAMVIKDNFVTGDYYLTATYSDKPDTAAVPHDVDLFMGRMKYRVEKAGGKFKWLRVIENLSGKGRPHFHILMSKVFDFETMKSIVKKIWPHGFVKIDLFGGDTSDAIKMASYFSKQKIEEHAGRISTSRNLVRRPPKKHKIKRSNTWTEKMVPPPGYTLIPHLCFNGQTADGYPMQRLVCEKIETPSKRGERRNE